MNKEIRVGLVAGLKSNQRDHKIKLKIAQLSTNPKALLNPIYFWAY